MILHTHAHMYVKSTSKIQVILSSYALVRCSNSELTGRLDNVFSRNVFI